MKTSISEKARVGVMTVGHREYWEWNQFPGMRENLIQIGKEISDCIAETGVEVFFEFVDNREGSYEAGLRLKEKNIDLLFLHVTTYAASGIFSSSHARIISIPLCVILSISSCV